MRIPLLILALLVALVVGTYVARDLLSGGAATISPPTARQVAILRLLNVERAHHGLPPMLYDAELARTARAQSAAMIAGNYFDHRGFERRLESIHRQERGEIISWGSPGYRSAAQIVTGWVLSPPHEAIILTRQFVRAGVGTQITDRLYQGFRGDVVATVDVSTAR